MGERQEVLHWVIYCRLLKTIDQFFWDWLKMEAHCSIKYSLFGSIRRMKQSNIQCLVRSLISFALDGNVIIVTS
ncbi:Hypothetical predicted protein [Olea europaea subsp. europaea]|uniref:Uncharacterized protein n=1 Tax=Olea europaea subsp. europaea TaxID=158383 RepID=A0A8S0RM03_OLEEU|nr:Hypothetical predicted protein [Olea europaea subsp. europaea]